jgi:hypothetical protein
MRDQRSTEELLEQAAQEWLRQSAGGDEWEGRVRDVIDHGKFPARPDRDMKDGAYLMRYSQLYRRCRAEGKLLLD